MHVKQGSLAVGAMTFDLPLRQRPKVFRHPPEQAPPSRRVLESKRSQLRENALEQALFIGETLMTFHDAGKIGLKFLHAFFQLGNGQSKGFGQDPLHFRVGRGRPVFRHSEDGALFQRFHHGAQLLAQHHKALRQIAAARFFGRQDQMDAPIGLQEVDKIHPQRFRDRHRQPAHFFDHQRASSPLIAAQTRSSSASIGAQAASAQRRSDSPRACSRRRCVSRS